MDKSGSCPSNFQKYPRGLGFFKIVPNLTILGVIFEAEFQVLFFVLNNFKIISSENFGVYGGWRSFFVVGNEGKCFEWIFYKFMPFKKKEGSLDRHCIDCGF